VYLHRQSSWVLIQMARSVWRPCPAALSAFSSALFFFKTPFRESQSPSMWQKLVRVSLAFSGAFKTHSLCGRNNLTLVIESAPNDGTAQVAFEVHILLAHIFHPDPVCSHETINFVANIQVLQYCRRWSAQFGGPAQGAPELHVMLADHVWESAKDLATASRHYLRGSQPLRFVEVLGEAIEQVGRMLDLCCLDEYLTFGAGFDLKACGVEGRGGGQRCMSWLLLLRASVFGKMRGTPKCWGKECLFGA
jgi:hypothetical protein